MLHEHLNSQSVSGLSVQHQHHSPEDELGSHRKWNWCWDSVDSTSHI